MLMRDTQDEQGYLGPTGAEPSGTAEPTGVQDADLALLNHSPEPHSGRVEAADLALVDAVWLGEQGYARNKPPPPLGPPQDPRYSPTVGS